MPAEKEDRIVATGGMSPMYVESSQMGTELKMTDDLPAGMKPESVSETMLAASVAPAPVTREEPPGMRPRMHG